MTLKRLAYVAFIRFSLYCTRWRTALFYYLHDPLKTKINLSYVERICSYRAIKGGYTLVTLPRIVTSYRDSVDGTRDRVTYQELVTR